MKRARPSREARPREDEEELARGGERKKKATRRRARGRGRVEKERRVEDIHACAYEWYTREKERHGSNELI